MKSAWMGSPSVMLGASLVLGGLAVASWSCSDALHLELPPAPTGGNSGTGAQGGSTTPPEGGGGAAPTVHCSSNSECEAPTAVCDPTRENGLGLCVECLVVSDCAFRPGTLCSLGECVCPTAGESYCGAGTCVDLQTSPVHCGSCDHPCFGACVGGECEGGWDPLATEGAPSARSLHTAVWTDSEMIVWGGSSADAPASNLGDGAIYDPATRSWRATSATNAPSARRLHTAVWTGTEMIVWGGYHDGSALGTGARYNPTSNTWLPITTDSAPTARYYHTAVWTTGGFMLVWGGTDGTDDLSTGGRYDPAADQWYPITAPAVPRQRHSAVWASNNMMLIYGGIGDDGTTLDTCLPSALAAGGMQYDPAGNSWTSLQTSGQPAARHGHTATMLGNTMLVWGGTCAASGALGNGAGYATGTMSWQATTPPEPDPRSAHTAVVIDDPLSMIVWGGAGDGGELSSGGIYTAGTNTWAAMPTGPSARRDHTAVSTGTTMIVWGGSAGGGRLADGGVFDPSAL